MQLYNAQDLTGLNAEERAGQEQEMMKVYTTFDEEGLDTALGIAESVALAKVESGGERTPLRPTESLVAAKQVRKPTPPGPTEDEDIVLQIRRRLSMRKTARLTRTRAR
jgi:hypothetical protein